jgi:carboxymethylenebutenolidase
MVGSASVHGAGRKIKAFMGRIEKGPSMGTMIEIQTLAHDGSFKAYCAEPASSPRAAVIVIQEIFGVNPGIREKCDAWAQEGYLALAPDLFWRIQEGVELDPDIPDQFQQAIGLMGKFDGDLAIADIEATIREARARLGDEHGKVGAVGFCLGGRLAYLTAARTDINASVSYYGVGLDTLLGESHAIAHPLMLHIPTADHFVPPEAQQAVHAGLDNHPKVTIHDYEGLDHGFAASHGQRRNETAAQLADSRTSAFFAQYLK